GERLGRNDRAERIGDRLQHPLQRAVRDEQLGDVGEQPIGESVLSPIQRRRLRRRRVIMDRPQRGDLSRRPPGAVRTTLTHPSCPSLRRTRPPRRKGKAVGPQDPCAYYIGRSPLQSRTNRDESWS